MFTKPNFHGGIVIATAVDDPENLNMITYSKNAQGILTLSGGYSTFIMKDLEFFLNFTLQSTVSDDYILEVNGSFGGIGKQLLENTADIAIPLSYYLPYRAKFLTVLHPLVREPILAIFRQPDSATIQDIFIGTFSTTLWISLASISLLMAFTYRLYVFISYENGHSFNYSEFDCILNIIASIAQQGWYRRETTMSGKMLTFAPSLFWALIFAAFCAAIISLLSIQQIPIKSFDELLSNHFIILTNPIQQWGKYIVPPWRSESEFLHEIETNYVNDEVSVQKSIEGGYAVLSTLDYFIPIARNQSYSDHSLCETVFSVTVRKMATYSGFYMNKHSSLRKPFNYGLSFMIERGLNHRRYANLLSETVLKCLESDFDKTDNHGKSLSLLDVSTAFALLLIGFLLSLTFLSLERINGKYIITKVQ